MLCALLKLIIQAGAQDVVGHFAADDIPCGTNRHGGSVAKVDVEVFYLHAPLIHERPFHTTAHRPATVILRSAERSGHTKAGRRSANLTMAIGPTASHVGQPVASSTHGVADAATNSPEPIELVGVVKGTGGGPRGENAGDGGNEEGSIALLARSLEIRLKAEYPLIYLP